jgi:hypothetical protein
VHHASLHLTRLLILRKLRIIGRHGPPPDKPILRPMV